jgi:prepilin-type N-terminal cleavage/methylation domain-containing protein
MRTGEDGFTLVEAIAALALAAIAAAGLMSALGMSRARTVEAQTRMLALAQARQVLSSTLAAARPEGLPRQGQVASDGLAWTITLSEKGNPYPSIQLVEVAVTWTAAGKRGVINLAGYRFASDE